MQLTDLVKPIEQCTDEELLERLRTIRNNRQIVTPHPMMICVRARGVDAIRDIPG